MATVALPVLTIDRTGTIAWGAGTIGTAGSPFTLANSGNQCLRVKSTAADAALVAAFINTLDGTTPPGKSLVTPGSATDVLIGPFPVSLYGTTVSFTGPVLATTTLWAFQFVPNL